MKWKKRKMGQQEIIKLLKRSDELLTSSEIAKRLGINQYNICRNLKRLDNQKLLKIKIKKVTFSFKPVKFYGLKI